MRVHHEAEKRRPTARLLAVAAALALAVALGLPTGSPARAAPKFKPVSGLKMEQDVVERKKSKPMKAAGGAKRNSGRPVARYHLEQAWPAK
jgi:hypothetical protein